MTESEGRCERCRISREGEGVVASEGGALSHEEGSVLCLVILEQSLRIKSPVAQLPVKPPDERGRGSIGLLGLNSLEGIKGLNHIHTNGKIQGVCLSWKLTFPSGAFLCLVSVGPEIT